MSTKRPLSSESAFALLWGPKNVEALNKRIMRLDTAVSETGGNFIYQQ
jgi:hypothetical protein